MFIATIFFDFWRFMQIITLIPTMGMLAYFVDGYNKANLLTPSYILTLFIVSVLALAWAIFTVMRRRTRNESAFFVAFVDICFVGAFIAGVYELRGIANANCSNFGFNRDFYITIGPDRFDGSSPFTASINKTCAMLKASFAFGIMNCIFFFFTAFFLLFMHKRGSRDVVEKREVYTRRRSHDSRRGHSRSASGHRSRRSHDSRHYRPYV